ncbi:hypothetical protein JCM10212_006485 [Sporobolomyces blumeae]
MTADTLEPQSTSDSLDSMSGTAASEVQTRPGLAELALEEVREDQAELTDSTTIATNPIEAEGEKRGGSFDEAASRRTSLNSAHGETTSGTRQVEPKRVTGVRLVLLMAAMLLVEFLVGLEQTIVVSATASISNDFQALQDIGWYGSAYLLTCCSFQPLYGRAFQFFPQRWAFATAFTTFEVGTLICALARNSTTFIAGRAMQGLGYAGLFIGILAIAANTLPLRLQAIFTSLMNLCYGTGTIVGPLVGGALTSTIGWRWCFWICLIPTPFVLAAIAFFCDPPPIPQKYTVKERLGRMDWGGAALLLSSTTCLLLALQRGGITEPWSSSTIIGLLVGFGTIFIAFLCWEAWLGDRSAISIRLLKTKNLGCLALGPQFACGVTFYSLIYYIPIYFQTVQGSSPLRSGIQMLPLILLNMFSGIVAGWICSKWGTWHYPMAYGLALTSIGAGLFSTMTDSTGTGKWVGYQLIAGSGSGALYMLSFIASQVLADPEDRPKSSALVCWTQIWSATVSVSASEAIYQNSFKHGVEQVPGVDAQEIIASGVSEFRRVVSAEYLPAVVRVAEDSLFKVFLVSAVLGAYGFCMLFLIQWKRIAKEPKSESSEKAAKRVGLRTLDLNDAHSGDVQVKSLLVDNVDSGGDDSSEIQLYNQRGELVPFCVDDEVKHANVDEVKHEACLVGLSSDEVEKHVDDSLDDSTRKPELDIEDAMADDELGAQGFSIGINDQHKPRLEDKSDCIEPPSTFGGSTKGFATLCTVRYCDVPARWNMIWSGYDGDVTRSEIESALGMLQNVEPLWENGNGNVLGDGYLGQAAYSASLLFEITGDIRALDVAVRIADNILALQNQNTPNPIVIWTGDVDPVWPTAPLPPNNKSELVYAGCEQGEIVAHMVNAALLILKSPCLWDMVPPVYHGPTVFNETATYYDRALAYVAAGDDTYENYFFRFFDSAGSIIQPADGRWWAVGDSRDPGTLMPWNRRMQMVHGLLKLAAVHETPAVYAPNITNYYDALVQRNVMDFLGALNQTRSRQDGKDIFKWDYSAGEEQTEESKGIHAFYDIYGSWLAWQRSSATYYLSNNFGETMAYTFQNQIYLGNGSFAGLVTGASTKKAYTVDSLWAAWSFYGFFLPEWYETVARSSVEHGFQGRTWLAIPLLWTKHALHVNDLTFWTGLYSSGYGITVETDGTGSAASAIQWGAASRSVPSLNCVVAAVVGIVTSLHLFA